MEGQTLGLYESAVKALIGVNRILEICRRMKNKPGQNISLDQTLKIQPHPIKPNVLKELQIYFLILYPLILTS